MTLHRVNHSRLSPVKSLGYSGLEEGLNYIKWYGKPFGLAQNWNEQVILGFFEHQSLLDLATN